MDGLFEVGEFGRTNFKTDVFLANLNKLNEVKKEYNNIVYDFTYTSSILNVFSFLSLLHSGGAIFAAVVAINSA
jgi:hypothetical protein